VVRAVRAGGAGHDYTVSSAQLTNVSGRSVAAGCFDIAYIRGYAEGYEALIDFRPGPSSASYGKRRREGLRMRRMRRIALSDGDDPYGARAGDVGVRVVAAESFLRGLIP